MIYMNNAFRNYEEFRELFGVTEHGNGEKSRRNKILLSLYKSRPILKLMASVRENWGCEHVNGGREKWFSSEEFPLGTDFYSVRTMGELYSCVMDMLGRCCGYKNLDIEGLERVSSRLYMSDDFHGLCEDGDVRSIRYVNIERDRVFKMRAGKFLRKLIEENGRIDAILPEQVKIWVCEEFAEKWKAYASQQILSDEYTLFVDDNFEDIYTGSKCKGSFGSCMTNDGYWTFYRDSVDAKAAYLKDRDGMIVARCIIYTDVIDDDGTHLRLAERQYSSDGDESLKRMLVMRLVEGGHIDGYKRVGADCHSPMAFVDCQGNPLKNDYLHIRCNLSDYDTVSYQDSFKYYDEDDLVAYNSGDDENLSVTGGEREDTHEDDDWSSYNGEYISEDDAYYVETRDDYFYCNQTVDARVYNSRNCCYRTETCFEGDCIEIGNDYYYAGLDAQYPGQYGISVCPQCGEYMVVGDSDTWFSELTEEDYCCESCMDEAERDWKSDNWTYSEYDDEYYECDDVVVSAMQWERHYGNCVHLSQWKETTIHVDTLNDLIDDGRATYIDGVFYIDDIAVDGEPVHFSALPFRDAA